MRLIVVDTICLAVLAASVVAAPMGSMRPRQDGSFNGLSFSQIDALTPPFGHDANVNPTGTGDCDGAVDGPDGLPIKVPCDCPPDRTLFINTLIENLNAGHVVNNPDVDISFPADNSIPSIQARFNAASVTLQNLEGVGKGCPQASTTWTAQLNAILSGASTSIAPVSTTGAPAPPASSSTEVPAPPVTSSTEAPAPPASSSTSEEAPAPTTTDSGVFNGLSFAQIDALTPPFGHDANVNPTGTGDCDGAVNGADGNPIKVPCDCPPDRTVFINSLIANLNAGHVVNNPGVGISFPTDNSIPSIQARFNAASVTLQNLDGAGKGCPQVSTTWTAQLNAILSGGASSSTPSPAAPTTQVPPVASPETVTTQADPAPAPATTFTSIDSGTSKQGSFNGLSFQQIDSLTPQFGHDANVNPTGSGDCDGAVNGADGKPIKVPCDCPPDRTVFINSLIGNLNAGHVVNNPSVGLSFPTDNSISSIRSRFNAASVTLQNLNGAGKGCPQVSTTWTAQLNAILSGGASTPSSAVPTTQAPPVASPVTVTTQADPAPEPATTFTSIDSGTSKQGSFSGLSFQQIDSLTPQFGHDANVNPTGSGDCDGAVNGANGKPIKVPCDCPPDRTVFINSLIGNLNAGHVVNNPSVGLSFPTDNSISSIRSRFNAASVTLQNLNGAGKGCPQVSTTWTAQLNAILSGGASTPSSAAPTTQAPPVASPASTQADPAPATTSTSIDSGTSKQGSFNGLSFQQIDSLTPQFGHDANVNPTGSGDCDGAVNGANGKPIKVPCDCPPDRTVFINSLIGNLNAGHVVNNPSVGLSFPTDNSVSSIRSRFNAASVTLQNLNGAGKGCPQVSTTWTAQLNGILAKGGVN